MADANILGALTSANASNFVTHYRHFYISSSTFYSYTCIFNYIWLNFERKNRFFERSQKSPIVDSEQNFTKKNDNS